ncbi:hypothetical protein ACFY00_15755 [Kitasatospora sp. NPDC001540]|uniref:hypothetical protein n=1 Tax=Kitasatospora sp. NPDC001540 TaxID=3364014 RepID=UPI0036A7EE89
MVARETAARPAVHLCGPSCPELEAAVKLAGEIRSSGVAVTLVLHAMSGMERAYIRDRALEGHESTRKRGRTIGGAGVTDESMLSMALRLRDQEMGLRDIAKRLVITTDTKKGRHPSPATVMRMVREHDEQAAAAARAWSPGWCAAGV